MNIFKRLLFVAPVLAVLMTISAPTASAITYTLNIDGSTGSSFGPGPYGTIDVTQNGANTVHFVITLASGFRFVQTGNSTAASSVGFNLVGTNIPLTLITGAGSTNWALQQGNVGGYNSNGVFGDFEYSLDCVPCGNGGSTPQNSPIAFDLQGAGLLVSQFNQLSTGGNQPAYFVVDVIGNGATGYVGVTGPPTTTPEPTSLLTLGLGIMAVGFAARRFVI